LATYVSPLSCISRQVFRSKWVSAGRNREDCVRDTGSGRGSRMPKGGAASKIQSIFKGLRLSLASWVTMRCERGLPEAIKRCCTKVTTSQIIPKSTRVSQAYQKLSSIVGPCHVLDEICCSKSLRKRQQKIMLSTIIGRLTLGPIVQDCSQSLQI
jgi:hypothetical protein